MTIREFISSLEKSEPPPEISLPLQALWYARKGDWEHSHSIAQEVPTPDGSWVHAWLHRVEGDNSNARYWYNRAGQPMPKSPVDEEWESIATNILTHS